MSDAFSYMKFRDWARPGDRQPGGPPLAKSRKIIALHHNVLPAAGRTPCDNFRRTLDVLAGRGLEGYQWLIDPSGVVGELCGHRIGEGVKNRNGEIISICFAGDFRRETPTLNAMIAAGKLVNILRLSGAVVPDLAKLEIGPHFRYVPTECPGPNTRHLGDSGAPLEDWVRYFAQINGQPA